MKKIIAVTGMHCGHCEKAVEDAIKAIDGVTKVKADREKNSVTVTMKTDIDEKLFIEAIENEGFTPGEVTVKTGLFG
ncbi:MAG: heavy-metal-associated domain-containing protein [Clostridia bacterium]|nr:heavy-metal-associated domain-containing protein [Clostridia bacterium]